MSSIIDIKVPPELWSSSIMPEGVFEKWLQPEGASVKAGSPIACIRIEGMLHELMAPSTGKLKYSYKVNSVIDPGCVVGQIIEQLDS